MKEGYQTSVTERRRVHRLPNTPSKILAAVPGVTDRVERLLQRLDLRLDHLKETLHFLIAGDGATGGSWGPNHSHMSSLMQ